MPLNLIDTRKRKKSVRDAQPSPTDQDPQHHASPARPLPPPPKQARAAEKGKAPTSSSREVAPPVGARSSGPVPDAVAIVSGLLASLGKNMEPLVTGHDLVKLAVSSSGLTPMARQVSRIELATALLGMKLQEASSDVRHLLTSSNESRDAAEKKFEKANQELTTMLLKKESLEADNTVLRSQLAQEKTNKDLAEIEARTLCAENERLKKEVEAAHDSLLAIDEARSGLAAELDDTKKLIENTTMNVLYTVWSKYRDLDFEFLREGTNQRILEIDAKLGNGEGATVADEATTSQVGGVAKIAEARAAGEIEVGAVRGAVEDAHEEVGEGAIVGAEESAATEIAAEVTGEAVGGSATP